MVLTIAIGAIVLTAILAIAVGTWIMISPLQRPVSTPISDTFIVADEGTDWRATFRIMEDSAHIPFDWLDLSHVYITVLKLDDSLGLGTTKVSLMVPGQSYSGVRFCDLGAAGQLDDGDYFAFDKNVYLTATRVTVEGHGAGWDWSINFGLHG